MDSQWVYEQETGSLWMANTSADEQENVLDWMKSIGIGAAQGAGTGAVAGPWGALIGGLIGGGLGALQQATQPQPAAQSPSHPPAPARTPSTPPPTSPTPPRPPASPSSPLPASNRDGAGAFQQVVQLLPQLVQLLQAIQPAATTQQSTGRAGESVADDVESWAGDWVPDSAFLDEQKTQSWDHERAEPDEHFELPEWEESTQSSSTGALPATSLPRSFPQTAASPMLVFSGEWVTDAESVPPPAGGFQWIG